MAFHKVIIVPVALYGLITSSRILSKHMLGVTKREYLI